MTLDIDQVIESVRTSRDYAMFSVSVDKVDALLGEIASLRRGLEDATNDLWRLEDWIGYIADHTSDPEIKYYCIHATDGDYLDVLDDADESDAAEQEAIA